MTLSRRSALQVALAGTSLQAFAAPQPGAGAGRGIEGQRKADRGDGTYLNPIVPGDHADPTILKDGADYWMTFSSFQSYPGAVLWHSRDLVNWTPVTAALTENIGTVWAMDLVKHQGRYYLYIPVLQEAGTGIYVIHASDIRGPWSAPIDLKIPGCIDPGHIVGEDGRRYLFVNGGRRVRLKDDGLSTDGPLQADAWQPWQYPKDWVVEMFAPEGPKLLRRGAWFYLVSAVGGTAGPPTSHMVTVARAASIHGPWEHCPHNPIVRTRSASEPWWSRGHASFVPGPSGDPNDWWMVYHGYEKDFRTLGRQALLEPLEWTTDGWPRAKGGTLNRPLTKPRLKSPKDKPSPAGAALSDDFSARRMGTQWSFHAPGADETARLRWDSNSLVIRGKGKGMSDCSPLVCTTGDRSYECSIDLEISGDGHGGLGLFYDERGHAGIGFSTTQMLTYGYGQEHSWMREALPTPSATRKVRIQLVNRENVVTFRYSHDDGRSWLQHPWQMEVSGLHHNVFGGFVSLRIALFSAGAGEVRARNFVYRGLNT